MSLTDQKGNSLYRWANFVVNKPGVVFTATRSSINIVTSGGAQSAQFANAPTPGITFSSTIDPSAPNDDVGPNVYTFVQIVSSNSMKIKANDDVLVKEVDEALDTHYPYPTDQPPSGTADSPTSQLLQSDKRRDRSDQFTMYLLWTSKKPGSMPVPLKSIDWSWSFDASLHANGWQWVWTDPTTPQPHDSQPAIDVSEHPEWANNWKDGKWVPYSP